MTNVGIIVGSLREGSFTKKIAQSVASFLPSDYNVSIIDINLDLYNEDLDQPGKVPASWENFRAQMNDVDAVIFATPEYNRSIPGGLKNAIDVGSRPMGSSVWDMKPALVLSVSPGAIGGFGANMALRQSLVFLNMPVVQQPEAYIGGVTNILDADGEVTEQRELSYFKSIADAFVDLINKNNK
ncbi:NADPH-dependent FMN reductase [Lentilactobacillus senioris]|uniref:Flavoprotein n=1 Tax=Lentilactobacillus senioris DSM 24302 = JCM 17472 TaxID=1423802 RepID=A0A0R2CNJ6_9LACO|nr:NAD(P)H-dependent oxidoreductase [Lentilactobacillus senioris]KRM93295.1 flavoprotein [Lentilactobacillus senioris DSM 24302 = JCM 17472]